MREFKFRAFDEKNKIMHYDFQFIESGDTVNDWIIFISDKQKLESNWRENPFPSQQFKKMQCIGLKDEKGNDIYEGDIIRFDTTLCGGHKGIGVVEWCDDFSIVGHPGWVLSCPGIAYQMELLDCEIIGNIYENPELLEVKNENI